MKIDLVKSWNTVFSWATTHGPIFVVMLGFVILTTWSNFQEKKENREDFIYMKTRITALETQVLQMNDKVDECNDEKFELLKTIVADYQKIVEKKVK